MKYNKKHSHTRRVVLFIIIALGLYVAAVRPYSDSIIRASNSVKAQIEAYNNEIASIRANLRYVADQRIRILKQEQIRTLQNKIRELQDQSSVMRPKS